MCEKVSDEREGGESGGAKEGDGGGSWRKGGGSKDTAFRSQREKANGSWTGSRDVYGKQDLGHQFSYKDKLLSLGDSGFLEVNMSTVEALNGWKDYLVKMSSEQANESGGESDGEEQYGEGEKTSWQNGGQYPKLKFSAEEYEAWCRPYMNSIIVKLLGKSFRVGFMRQRMERMWNPKSPMKVTPLNNGYFIVSFSTKEDRDYALLEGPWMIADHYLMVQRWRPNFNPWKADLQKRIAAWIRIPDLPAELYSVESLRRLGNLVGRTLKIDRTTAFSEKGGFARLCVEIDLGKPLLPAFVHFGEVRRIEYEGLHLVCFHCGQYGHHIDVCSHRSQVQQTGEATKNLTPEDTTGEGKDTSGKSKEGADMGGSGGIFGPHMLVKRNFSRLKFQADIQGSSSSYGAKTSVDNQRIFQKGNERDKRQADEWKNVQMGNFGDKRQFGAGIKENKQEKVWVPVESKKKVGLKRRARGKENKLKVKVMTRGNQEREGQNAQDIGTVFSNNPFYALNNGPNGIIQLNEKSHECGPEASLGTVGLNQGETIVYPEEANVSDARILENMDKDMGLEQHKRMLVMTDVAGDEDMIGEIHPTNLQMV